MRKVILIFMLLLSYSVTAFAYKNEPTTFRGMKWGMAPAEIAQMTNVTLVQNPFTAKTIFPFWLYGDGNYKLCDIDITNNIELEFFHNKLFLVEVPIGDGENDFLKYNEMKEKLIALYGYPDEEKDFLGRMAQWKGVTTNISLIRRETCPVNRGKSFAVAVRISNKTLNRAKIDEMMKKFDDENDKGLKSGW